MGRFLTVTSFEWNMFFLFGLLDLQHVFHSWCIFSPRKLDTKNSENRKGSALNISWFGVSALNFSRIVHQYNNGLMPDDYLMFHIKDDYPGNLRFVDIPIELINLSKRGTEPVTCLKILGPNRGQFYDPQKQMKSISFHPVIIWQRMTTQTIPKKKRLAPRNSVKIPIETHAESVEVQECSYMGVHQKV